MKVTFFSNYLNHHQLSFCEEMLELTNGDFRFVACTPIKEERLKLGYEDMNCKPFVIRAYENCNTFDEAMKLAVESDIAIHGSAPECFIQARMEIGLPTFRYSERFFKKGFWKSWDPRVIYNNYKRHKKYRNKPLYMLCASAFTAVDTKRIGAYKNKCYKWGYFPDVKYYEDVEKLMSEKEPNHILWAGRLIGWKHPEYAIEIARRLKADGYDFKLNMIGTGALAELLEKAVAHNGLEDCVSFLGSMSPEEVRRYMEKSAIYLFTSDQNEGWGAVLNESMNSACAVVASHLIGSVPFVVNNGENGFIYESENADQLYEKVKFLLDNPQKRENIGRAAYVTMIEQWNARNAAKRFYELAKAVIEEKKASDIFSDGVCSKAEVLSNNWLK